MARKSHGLRCGTRKIFRKNPRQRGHIAITRRLQTFEKGDRVAIVIEPAFQRGMPHRRFQGLTGIVRTTQGRAYVVDVPIGKSKKTVISHPVHLKRLE